MIYLRVGLALLIIGGGWYIKHLIGVVAVQDQQIAAERAALADYSKIVTDDINGYKVALGAVMNGYQTHDEERARLEKLLSKHDLASLAKSKPGLVAKRINAGTARLFMELESASGKATSANDAGATEAVPNTP